MTIRIRIVNCRHRKHVLQHCDCILLDDHMNLVCYIYFAAL